MTGIIVFNGFDENRLIELLTASQGRPGERDGVHVLWLAGRYSRAASTALATALYDIPMAFGADRMRSAFLANEHDLRTWSGDVLVPAGLEKVGALTRLADLNLSDALWTRMVQIAVIRSWIGDHPDMETIRVEGGDAGWRSVIASMGLVGRTEQSSTLRRHGLANWASSLWTYCCNAAVEARTLMHRPETSTEVKDVAIVGLEARNWKRMGDRDSLRFTLGLPDALRKQGVEHPQYLLSLSRRNQRRLAYTNPARGKRDAGVAYLEAHGSWLMWVRKCLNPDVFFKYIRHRTGVWRAVHWLDTDITHWVRDHARKALIEEYPKNRMLVALARSAAKAAPVPVAVVPVHEMAEMRCIIAGLKASGTKVVGVQQGALGGFHRLRYLPRFDLAHRAGLDLFPDHFLCEGDVAADTLRNWLESQPYEASVLMTGAMRISRLPSARASGEGTKDVLVLGEMHDQENALHWATRCSLRGFRTVFRPHPARRAEAIDFVSHAGLQVDLDVDGKDLDASLSEYNPRVVLCSNTGAAVEVALAGFPILLMPSNDRPPFSPMDHPKSRTTPDLLGPDGEVSPDLLTAIGTDGKAEEDRGLAQSHIACIGEEACERTASVVISVLRS